MVQKPEPLVLNISQGSVATHVRCSGNFNKEFTANSL